MKRLAYCGLVWLVALAFVAGNATAHSCATLHAGVPQAGHATAHADHPQDSHAAHHHAAAAEVAASTTHDTSPVSDHHACPTCCGLCTLASVTPPAPRFAVTLAISRVVFEISTERLTDWRVLLDPDIPKSLA